MRILVGKRAKGGRWMCELWSPNVRSWSVIVRLAKSAKMLHLEPNSEKLVGDSANHLPARGDLWRHG